MTPSQMTAMSHAGGLARSPHPFRRFGFRYSKIGQAKPPSSSTAVFLTLNFPAASHRGKGKVGCLFLHPAAGRRHLARRHEFSNVVA